MKKEILCYGDSNTWGYMPGGMGRYGENVRWTGVLQNLLGDGYHVQENGINGRTTAFDDPEFLCRNGLEGIGYALTSGKPFDLVAVMLGTNDLKFVTANRSAAGAKLLIETLQAANEKFPGSTPVFRDEVRILLISPIEIGGNALSEGDYFDMEQSRLFAAEYEAAAREMHVHFLDAAKVASPCPVEGTHMLPEGHAALAQAVAEKVRDILENNAAAL
ncbi:MAG: hypothetical protein IJN00_06785 [Clostridia bacterium]|nr:hypothetical protein [Clostridia bacterium]